MKEIELTKGYKAIVDDVDFEYLSQYSWNATGKQPYAAMRKSKYGKYYYMHRLVMERVHGNIEGKYVDHINHNTLDNRRQNLRVCTMSENLGNSRKLDKSTISKHKGVCYIKSKGRRKRWVAYIDKNGKRKNLGYFHTEDEAAQAYNDAAKEVFGEFAYLNNV